MKGLGLACLVGLAGCANIEIRRAHSIDDEGLHFYRPDPYLVLSPGTGGCNADIKYLPNYSQDYVIIPHAGMGAITFNPTLDNGWNLTGLNASVDSKANEMVGAIGGIIGSLTSLAAKASVLVKPPATADEVHPGLYKLDLHDPNLCKSDTWKCLIKVFVDTNQSCQAPAQKS